MKAFLKHYWTPLLTFVLCLLALLLADSINKHFHIAFPASTGLSLLALALASVLAGGLILLQMRLKKRRSDRQ